jgi:hypothetical protein
MDSDKMRERIVRVDRLTPGRIGPDGKFVSTGDFPFLKFDETAPYLALTPQRSAKRTPEPGPISSRRGSSSRMTVQSSCLALATALSGIGSIGLVFTKALGRR